MKTSRSRTTTRTTISSATKTKRTTTKTTTRTTTRTPEEVLPPKRRPGAVETLACLGLGSNVGAGEEIFLRAITHLRPFFDSLRVGPLLRGPAVAADGSPLPHADYLNTVVAGMTRLSAHELLAVAKRIEYLAGRRLGPRDAPRRLDIDLLLFGDRVSHHPELTLPHPRLTRRRFALLPLAKLLPDFRLPTTGTPLREALAALEGEGAESADPLRELDWSHPGVPDSEDPGP